MIRQMIRQMIQQMIRQTPKVNSRDMGVLIKGDFETLWHREVQINGR